MTLPVEPDAFLLENGMAAAADDVGVGNNNNNIDSTVLLAES